MNLLPLIVVASCALAGCGGDGDKPPPATMTTVAGGGKEHGDGGPATSARFCGTSDVALDAAGNMYIADGGANCSGPGGNTVRKVDPRGIVTTVAGTGLPGYSGDGGPARSARLSDPGGLAFDASGSLYVADHVAVRRIDPSGTITTVAGNGNEGFSGNGGPATEASMTASDVAFDDEGNMYLSDTLYHRVRMVDGAGVISTVAGSGELAPLGDGGPATSASIDYPVGVAVDGKGNLLIAEHHGNRIRKVDPKGTITTIAGTGQIGFSGERGAATKLQLNQPWGLLVAESGLVYVADAFNARVRAVRYADSY